MLKTRIELIIDHQRPLDAEQLGQMVSNATRNVPNAPQFKGNITQVVTSLIEWNQYYQ